VNYRPSRSQGRDTSLPHKELKPENSNHPNLKPLDSIPLRPVLYTPRLNIEIRPETANTSSQLSSQRARSPQGLHNPGSSRISPIYKSIDFESKMPKRYPGGIPPANPVQAVQEVD
jgi:hypothetical protein